MKLILGVIELPYAHEPGGHAAGAGPTTGDVAKWLEDKYHVMEVFYELHHDEIAGFLLEGAMGVQENIALGAPGLTPDFVGDAHDKIRDLFQKFIDSREMESLGIPGVPTQAAIDGVQSRMKSKKGPRRASFRDTGLYETAFRSWME